MASGAEIGRLAGATRTLGERAAAAGLPCPAGEAWYRVLTGKLATQAAADEAVLIAAVVGGTNTGKSTLFNHLAGRAVSGVTPFASGTKHPVAAASPANGAGTADDPAGLFPAFRIERDAAPEAAFGEEADDLLFWHEAEGIPSGVVLLDTPDVDSDAPVNWERAAAIRAAVDLLFVTVTAQKYNDAAVLRYLKAARAEGRMAAVVFSLADLPGERGLFAERLETIASATGLRPVAAFAVGRDREAAKAGTLSYQRVALPEGLAPSEPVGDAAAADPGEWLATVSATPVKERTLAESLRHVLDPSEGLPEYLDRLRSESRRTAEALGELTGAAVVGAGDWPGVPTGAVVAEVREWWGERRRGWARMATAPYQMLGQGLRMLTGTAAKEGDRLGDYADREWAAIVEAVGTLSKKLATLEDELGEPVGADATRAEQLDALRKRHAESDPAGDLRDLVASELTRLKAEHPTRFAWLERADAAVTIGRPAVSAGLFFTFGGADLVLSAATQSLAAAAADIVTGTAATAAGEAGTVGLARTTQWVQAAIQRLGAKYAEHRLAWLAGALRETVLAGVTDRLGERAGFAGHADFTRVEELLAEMD